MSEIGFNENEEEAKQWYVETTYKINKTTLGVSYGEGEDDIIAGDGEGP
ncbi:hypothetical protein [Marinobacter gelidimuriae]|nr:hypothetical protein [Marinobacter gelidimuriae]